MAPVAAWLLAMVLVTPVGAEEPSRIVGAFYAPVTFVADPGVRFLFIDPARSVLDRHDAATAGGSGSGCIGFSPAIDAQDFDEDEVARSLQLAETLHGNEAEVTASFRVFATDTARREVVWSLRRVDGAWRIADLATADGAWRLGTLECDP